jgi:hypothetical protein
MMNIWSMLDTLPCDLYILRGAGERMKCPKVFLFAAGLAVFVSGHSLADNIRVIADSRVKADAISAAGLSRVFLKERVALADGSHVEPVLE